VVCVDTTLLSASFSGCEYDPSFLADLPKAVDPCGENGEFHTFAFKGPIFSKDIAYKTGEKIFKEYKAPENPNDTCVSDTTKKLSGFWYCDLIPA